jgi:hypothetical protein
MGILKAIIPHRNTLFERKENNREEENEQDYDEKADQSNWFSKIRRPNEHIQITAVTEDGNNIKYIEEPSEKVQIVAVTQN